MRFYPKTQPETSDTDSHVCRLLPKLVIQAEGMQLLEQDSLGHSIPALCYRTPQKTQFYPETKVLMLRGHMCL